MKKLGLLALLVVPVLIGAMGGGPSWPELHQEEYENLRYEQEERDQKRLREGKRHEAQEKAAAAERTFQSIPADVVGIMAEYMPAQPFQALRVLRGHTNWVNSASFSPDGRYIVTANIDGTAYIWDVRTGKTLYVLQGTIGSVNSASFSPDGRHVVTGGSDGTRIWDIRTGKVLHALRGVIDLVSSASFSPDGRHVVTGGIDGARIWNAETGAQLRELHGQDWVNSASFSHDGRYIVTAGHDGTVYIWNAATGAQLRELRGRMTRVNSASFSRDGRYIVTVGDRTARIWDAATGEQLRELEGHSGAVSSASFSPDGRYIVTGEDDGTVHIWDAVTGEQLHELQGHTGSVTSATFSPDGKYVVTSSYDETTRLWENPSHPLAHVHEGYAQSKSHKKPSNVAEMPAQEKKAEMERKWQGALADRPEREGLKQQFAKLRSHENIDQLLSVEERKNLNDIIASLGTKNVTNQDLEDLRKELEEFNEKIEQQSGLRAEKNRMKAELKQKFEVLRLRPDIESLLSEEDMGRLLTDTFAMLSKNVDVNDDQMKELGKLLEVLEKRVENAQQNKERWLGELNAITRDYALMLTDDDKKLIAECRATLEQPVSAKRDQRIVAGITRLKKELQKRVSEKVK